ncbi:fluoride efflux transporter FluC [Oenococcus alcoholitolerans]|uniref:Fluoride-specific ion channel FluC n=1 Tax=Oenococcus alcoholitolerans TaxID=931074 RepID=A0ABR4XRA8_9LACO|nr:hypothetical protein Q757_03520 [Oenococcus alcoholitolerans]
MRNFLIILICGFIGGGIRELIELSFASPIHLATLFINLFGALLMGLTYGLIRAVDKDMTIFSLVCGTGLVGSFTTFSTFISEINDLAGFDLIYAIIYLLASVFLGILALLSGIRIAGSLYRAA